jgi:hypothetical protein
MILDIIREVSHFFFDIGFPLPCWDVIADSLGVCKGPLI